MMNDKEKLKNAIRKELVSIAKAEAKLKKNAQTNLSKNNGFLKDKIPYGLKVTLEKSFFKAFEWIFKNGTAIIEKSYNKEDLSGDFKIRDYAIDLKCNRKELKKLKKQAQKSDLKNMSITAVEGVGLGALGIGLPDIVIFTGMRLKGIYEVALRYGYDYELPQEKYFILLMMKTALSKGEKWITFNAHVDDMIGSFYAVNDDILICETEEASKAFATDMLVSKFIQGLPVVGIIGGVLNPVYYSKILSYVRLKYHKRYLTEKLSTL